MFDDIDPALLRQALTGMSDQQLATIGFISVIWNGLERNMVACIWAAADWTQELGELVTADLGNVSRADLLMNIVKQRVDDPLLQEQAQITIALYDFIRSARNDLMHGFFNWRHRGLSTDEGLVKLSAKKRSGSVEMKVIPVGQSVQDQLAFDMRLCNESFHDLLNKLYFRNRFLAGERGAFAQNYHDAVHGWREPSFEISLVRECLKRRSQRPNPPQNPSPPAPSQA